MEELVRQAIIRSQSIEMQAQEEGMRDLGAQSHNSVIMGGHTALMQDNISAMPVHSADLHIQEQQHVQENLTSHGAAIHGLVQEFVRENSKPQSINMHGSEQYVSHHNSNLDIQDKLASENVTAVSSNLTERQPGLQESLHSNGSVLEGHEEPGQEPTNPQSSGMEGDVVLVREEMVPESSRCLRSDIRIKEEMVKERIKCHSSSLSSGMSNLWTCEQYCDCILVVDEKEIKCHSCVIASFSPLLQIKLNTSQNRTRLEGERLFVVLDLSGVMVFDELEPLIKYMYTGELCFKRAQVYDILKSAQFLGLKEIQQFCFVWMVQNITVAPTPTTLNKTDGSEADKANAQKSSDENAANATGNTNEKEDEFLFQDYIDILNSWQKASTEEPVNVNVNESLGHSLSMLRDSAGAKMLSSLQLQGKNEPPVASEGEEEHAVPVMPMNNIVVSRKRKAMKGPLRLYHGNGSVDDKKDLAPSDGFLPTDMLYVNFSNDKLLPNMAVKKRHNRIVVLLPSAAGEAELGYQRDPPVRKRRKQRMKIEIDSDVDEGDDLIDGDGDDNLEGNEEIVTGKGKGKGKKKRKKRKYRSKAMVQTDIVINVGGEEIKCSKTLDEDDRMTLKCPICSRPFWNPNLLKEHVANHTNDSLSPCPICGHAYIRSWHLSRHIRCHTGIRCKHCDFSTKSPKKFSVHSEKEHGIAKAFVCTHEGCTYRTNKHHQLYDHMPIHSEIKPYKCIHCGKTCAHRSGLASHLKSCLQKRDRVCDLCGKAFNQLGTLKSHLRVHYGEKPYACTECPSRFSEPQNLKRHLTVHQKGTRAPSFSAKKASATTGVTRPAVQPNRKTQNPDFRYMPQPFSTDPKPACAVPGMQQNMNLPQKAAKLPEVAVSQGQQHFLKRTENGPQDLNQGQYSQMIAFQETQRKLLPPPSMPQPTVSDSMPMRPLEYQPNISMAHTQPPMTAGYSACLAPFSPLVTPDLHSFYSSQGLIPTGHLEVHPHPSITPSGGRPPTGYPQRAPSSYQQLHDYTMANVWKAAHEDLNSSLHNHNYE